MRGRPLFISATTTAHPSAALGAGCFRQKTARRMGFPRYIGGDLDRLS